MSREAVWEDDLTLWTNTVKDQPESYRARVNLGKEYMLAGRYDAAEVQIKTALKLTRSLPDRADMECLLGSAHLVQGAYEPAVTALRRGLELRPGDGDCRSALAMALMKLGRGQSALREAKQAAMGNGRVSLENLIRVYDHLARPCDAASVCAKLRQLYPDQMAGGVSVYCRSAEPSCE